MPPRKMSGLRRRGFEILQLAFAQKLFNFKEVEMLTLKKSALIGLLVLVGAALGFNQATSSLISSQEAPLLFANDVYGSGGG